MSLIPPGKNALLAAILYPETVPTPGASSTMNALTGLYALGTLDSKPGLGLGAAYGLPQAPTLPGAIPQGNALTGLYGLRSILSEPQTSNAFLPRSSSVESLYPSDLPTREKIKRRVFFSFHYQADINRVNVVRNSWRFRPEDGTQPADWFDHSIWEEAKRTGVSALKRLIHGGMNGSSVTCVLAGQETWSRPWVRYEIAYALARGNGLLTVHIDGVKCMKDGLCQRGPNPLDYIGLKWEDDVDKAYLWENFHGQWRRYPLYREAVSWPKWLRNVTERRFIMPLSNSAMAYDYARQEGYKNLSRWTRLAADQARK